MIVATGVGLRMLRTVVLRHTQLDGSSHFDWMIERPEPTDDRSLRTWRTGIRPDQASAFQGQQIGDHRSVYLEYEGELGGGRGRVERLASGLVRWDRCDQDRVALEVVWDNGQKLRFEGQIQHGDWWWFQGSAESLST